jgi:rhamnulokinase
VSRRWSTKLLEKLGLPATILPEVIPPGVRLGSIRPEVADATGLDPATPVFTSASHDTASAVAAVPAKPGDWCYISSGTWSLMGAELDEPIVNAKALAANLTNEIGVAGKIRLLKNIAGLWLVQECRRAWIREGREWSYAELADMAGDARPFTAVIPPDAFLEPGHMPERIAEYCRSTGQAVPGQPGEMVRCILESLALRYRQVLESIESVLGHRIETIHIVGGGSQNQVLNQLVSDATGRSVVAGPTEATAAGNLLVQAIGAGQLKDLDDARQVIRSSFPVTVLEPSGNTGWESAYQKFLQLG